MCQGLICFVNEFESTVVYRETPNANYFEFESILNSLFQTGAGQSTDLPTYSMHQTNVLWL